MLLNRWLVAGTRPATTLADTPERIPSLLLAMPTLLLAMSTLLLAMPTFLLMLIVMTGLPDFRLLDF
jgi:hypothetical protein